VNTEPCGVRRISSIQSKGLAPATPPPTTLKKPFTGQGIEALPHKFSRSLRETDKFRCHGSFRPCVRSMSPLSVVSYRHPFAPPALPGFLALMGAPDFRQSRSLPRLLHLSESASVSTPTGGSLRAARHGLGPRGGSLCSPWRAKNCGLLAH